METAEIIKLAASGFGAAMFFILRIAASRKNIETPKGEKPKKNKLKLLSTAGIVVCVWYFVGTLLTQISPGSGGLEIHFEMFSPRTEVFGISVAQTTLLSYFITLIVLVLALIFRIFVFPRFKEEPGTFQILMESAVDEVQNFVNGATHGGLGDVLPSYMMAVAIFMVGSAMTELFGLRAPTSDLLTTFSMAMITFFLINYYGIKMKGLGGRIKSFANPTPVVFPFKIISDVATPVSLACRLFGNMMGGMIVLELLKSSLGTYGAGIPAVAGLYFNLFHPLIQTYIFIILSLTFINEAVE